MIEGMPELSEYCVYTIKHSKELQHIASGDGRGKAFENKAWVTGSRLFGEAEATGRRLPIVFAAAEEWSGLIFWALLTDVTIDQGDRGSGRKPRTSYAFESLTEIRPPRAMTDLTVASTRRPLSKDSIRPYAICLTPLWLRAG